MAVSFRTFTAVFLSTPCMKHVYLLLTALLLACVPQLARALSVVDAGNTHSLSIHPDGTLWAWGANDYGQLGDGTLIDRHLPVQIGTATTWASIIAGTNHGLALRQDGSLWAWGRNQEGQLADGTTTLRYAPVPASVPATWTNVNAGASHGLGVRPDGALWAWGDNYYGQLGKPTLTPVFLLIFPTSVGTAVRPGVAGAAPSLALFPNPATGAATLTGAAPGALVRV
jgi:alpha-tubulin suppressor-like RCC1 family protein